MVLDPNYYAYYIILYTKEEKLLFILLLKLVLFVQLKDYDEFWSKVMKS